MSAGSDALTIEIRGKDVGLEAVLNRVDQEMQKSADQAVKLGQSYARLAVAQGKPAAASQLLAGTIGQAGAASEKALIGIETQAARLATSGGGIAQFGASAASSLTSFLGPAALATAAIGGLIAVGKSFGDAFKFKADLDATTLAVNAQIKGVRDSGQVWQQAAGFAKEFKLTQEETTKAVQASIGVMRNSKASVEDILGVLARMQVLSPEQSLEEAAIALKSLAAGDTTSLVTRFEVSRDLANQMKTEIQGGADAVAVMSKFLGDTGIGMDVLKTKTEGASGALKDVAKAQEDLKIAQAAFAQGPGMELLRIQTSATTAATRILTGELKATAAEAAAGAASQVAFSQAMADGAGIAGANAAAQQAYAASMAASATAVAQNTDRVKDDTDAMTQHATAAQTAAAAAATHTAEVQKNAEAAVIAAANQQAQTAATVALTASTTAAVTAFLGLNPNIDAAGIAAAVAAGKIPALVGQLANLRIAAFSARDAMAALAAQQNLATTKLVGPGGVGVNAPGITSGRNNDIDAVLKLQKANADAAKARSDQIVAVGTAQQKTNELERQYAAAVKATGADSAQAIDAQTKLLQAREKAATKAAKGKGAGGVKLSDTQKINNSLLASQEQYEQKSEDAATQHAIAVEKINQDFYENMRAAQQEFDLSQLEGRASFYDTMGGIESQAIQQQASQAYEAASIQAGKIAAEKGADVAEKYMDAQEQIISSRAKRLSDIEAASNKKDKKTYDPARAEYLRGVDAEYKKAEDAKLARIQEGAGSIASEHQKQLDEAAAKEADAQDKIGLSAERAADRQVTAADRAGKKIDENILKAGALAATYDRIAPAAGGTPAGGTPAASAAPGTPAAAAPGGRSGRRGAGCHSRGGGRGGERDRRRGEGYGQRGARFEWEVCELAMASNLVISGTTFSGTPLTPATSRKPDSISVAVNKVGVVLVMASGVRRYVVRGTVKRTWVIEWGGAREATRSAVRAIHQLTAVFSFTDELGVTYATCQTEGEDDYSESSAFTDPSNNIYYDLSLTIREA